jgi:hypothetical protein
MPDSLQAASAFFGVHNLDDVPFGVELGHLQDAGAQLRS